MKSVIVIPTYQESETLPGILDRILDLGAGFRILIVDDNSPDGTGAIADDYAARHSEIEVLHRPGKQGIGTAYLEGFRRALDAGADLVFEMDADHSHNPKFLAGLRDALCTGADLALGSRYRNGVRVENWPFRRLLLSRLANYYVNFVTGMPSRIVSDATSGFRGYRREVLEAIDFSAVHSNGYCFQVEMVYRTMRLGFQVREVPICFEEHYLSPSKISRAIVWEAIWRIPLLRLRAPKRRPRAVETPTANSGQIGR